MNQDFGSFFQSIFRMDRSVGGNFENQFFVVGFLLDTEVILNVFYIADRRKNRIDGNHIDRVSGITVLFCRNVTSAFIDIDFDLEICAFVHVTDHQVGIQHFKSGKVFTYISGFEHIGSRYRNRYFLSLDFFHDLFESHLFEVENNVGYIFDDTGYGRELVLHTADANRCNGKAFKGVEEDTAQRVTDGNGVARLQGTEFEFTEKRVGLEHEDFIGFLKC